MTPQLSSINLSINPTFLCNFRCSFCYLTKEQLSDRKTLPLPRLESLLKDLSSTRLIENVDLYGGEVGLLSEDYLRSLKSIVSTVAIKPINIITNLSRINPVFLDQDISLTVSWDYDCREKYQKVLKNITSIDKDVHILMLASPEMLSWSDDKIGEVINIFNSIKNISSVEIKPYSSNQANQFLNTDSLYENFVMKWILKKNDFNFLFVNDLLIQESLRKEKNSWSDDHIYITPNGELAVLDFDENNHEYFNSLGDFSDYENWCTEEKSKIKSNEICNSCEYLGHCLSEHLRLVKADTKSCSGFKRLLDWYDENLQGFTKPSQTL